MYRSLGMQSSVADMQQSIRTLTSNIEEDAQALNHMQAELSAAVLRFANSLTVGTPGRYASVMALRYRCLDNVTLFCYAHTIKLA